MPVKFDVVFCDDIRKEDNGKVLLVGAYIENIVAKLPTNMSLSFWVRIFEAPSGKSAFKFRMDGPSGEIAKGDGELLVTDEPTSTGVLEIKSVPVQFDKAGVINFWLQWADRPEEIIGSIAVLSKD